MIPKQNGIREGFNRFKKLKNMQMYFFNFFYFVCLFNFIIFIT